MAGCKASLAASRKPWPEAPVWVALLQNDLSLTVRLRTPFSSGPLQDDGEGDEEEQQQQQQEQQQQQPQPAEQEAVVPEEGAKAEGGEDREEGETSPPKAAKPLDAKAAAAEARRVERAAAEEELKARRRMLGNIQFIGHLYRYGMLTENIMHRCGSAADCCHKACMRSDTLRAI